MRVLVYPHDLAMGGSQLNAIELASAMRDRGHEVLVYGRAGALNSKIADLSLEFVESPPVGIRPTQRVVRHLARTVRERQVDVIHGFEWPPILEARLAARTVPDCVAVGTVMSMAVAPFIPKSMVLTVGTRQIAEVERQAGRDNVTVLEPPVDLEANSPSAVCDSASVRRKYGVPQHSPLVVVVGRLADQLKLEGILTATRVVPELGDATLLVVGDGPARALVTAAARESNQRAGRQAVIPTGAVQDPRDIYAAADVVLGMGGSALRGLAFGKSLVVQGEQGFWRALTPDTLEYFRWAGWYGVGEGVNRGPAALRRELLPLIHDRAEREERGRFARRVCEEGYSLTRAAAELDALYHDATTLDADDRFGVGEAVAKVRWARYVFTRQVAHRLGRVATDDFNAKPVAAEARSRA